jgi:B12-binding domain/radical SAM domain protein
MKRQARFTFITDRTNRTATASLLASLERFYGDVRDRVRVVTPKDAVAIRFEPSAALREVLCVSSMTAGFSRVAAIHHRMRALLGGKAFRSICGGSHPSGDPLGALRAGFDYCCVGEGESVIQNVAEGIESGAGLDAIGGLLHLEAGRVAGRGRGEPTDLGRFPPLPSRLKFPTLIEIGRGCRWGCAYCQTPAIHGRAERFRNPEAVAEIVAVYERFGMRDFRFLLPNALGYGAGEPGQPDCEALAAVLEAVSKRVGGGRIFLGSFPSEVRPDYVTDDAIRLLKAYVANRKIVIGGQSGSQRLLDLIHRGHSVDDIQQACDTVSRSGFEPWVDLMLGFPDEGADDRRATLDLAARLGKQGARITMHFFMPLPGTQLAESRPVFLEDTERRELDRLAQQGIVRGRWRRQEAFARRWPDRI